MSKDEKNSSNGKRPPHTGSVAAEDEEFTLWLNRLWARNEPPERIELWQMFGKNKITRGEMIYHEDFKPGEKLDIEQANRLANEILEAAQNDCDAARKESHYQLAVIDRHRKATPLVRRVGPIQPKRTYALKALQDIDNEEDDEGLNAASLMFRQLKEGFDQTRWEKQRNDRIVEGMLLLQDTIIKNQQTAIDRFFDKVVTSFEKMQEAEDRRVQRDVLIEKEKFKISLMKDGIRTARNLLPGLFNGTETATPSTAPTANGNGTNGNGANGHTTKSYGHSPERTLVDNFLNDCEEAEIDIALFGDTKEDENGKLVFIKPGIFTPKQLRILVGVRAGHLPAAALDELMPKSNHETAITEDQINKAIAAGVTDGIGSSLFEIVGLRQRAQQAAQDAAEAAEAAPTT
jgi:hypothetical protein